MSFLYTYQSDMEQLFREWKKKESGKLTIEVKEGRKIRKKDIIINHSDNIFITDGVVCPQQWYSQKVRPLFLLKEAYTRNGIDDWDLFRDHLMLSDKKMSLLWKRVCQWTIGILNTTKDSIYAYTDQLHDECYGNDILQKIAVVNVKKSGGRSSSSMSEINQYADFDKNELRRELECVDPTVIICGYTISSLNIIMGKKIKDYDYPNENWFYRTSINGHDVVVLDYYHPANQFPDLLNYYGLMGIYQKALQEYEK